MIHEVDEALHALLSTDVLGGGDIEVVFHAPTPEWAARRNAPTINVFLYDLRENLGLRHTGGLREYGERREIVAEHEPPRWYALSYLVTAWTKRPQDEHRLLSILLAGLLRHSALEPHRLGGTLAEFGAALPYTVAVPPAGNRSLADVWSALGGELKPSLDLVVTAPVAAARYPVTVRVTDGLLLSVADASRPSAQAGAGDAGSADAGTLLEVRRPRFEGESAEPAESGAYPVGVRRTRGATGTARPGGIGR